MENNKYINKKPKPSPFLVELTVEDEKKPEKKGFFDFWKKISSKFQREYFEKPEENIYTEAPKKNFFNVLSGIFKKIDNKSDVLKHLAFWPFFKFFYFFFKKIFFLIYGFFYKIGYFFVSFFFFFSSFFKFNFFKPKSPKQEYKSVKSIQGLGGKFFVKKFFAFAFLLLLFIVPLKVYLYYNNLQNLKGRVLGVSETAVSDIKDASASIKKMDFAQARKDFSKAQENFALAQSQIKEISTLINVLEKIVPAKNIKMGKNAELILQAGELSSRMGFRSLLLAEELKLSGMNPEKLMDIFNKYADDINLDAKNLQKILKRVDPDYLPPEYQDKFNLLQSKSDLVLTSIDELIDFFKKIKIFLGEQTDKRYLLVFQNNAEMRASGGFVGSFALVDFSKGKIINLEIPEGGGYDTEAGLKERIISPKPLHLVNPLWHFWDANWWPDWRKSAKKLEWFYEKSNGPSVDGVIAFTPTVMEGLLKIIGPIDMSDDYGVIIDADNFRQVVQTRVEAKNLHIEEKFSTSTSCKTSSASSSIATSTLCFEDKKEKPKKIIKDLMNKILEVLPQKLNKDHWKDFLALAENSLREKHILLYFNDEDLEKQILDYNWGGEMKNTLWDYLMVVNTNIGGQKTDLKISQNIKHYSDILEDGTVVDTLKIIRKHNGLKGELFTGVRNVDWMRIYVPLGSELIEARGFSKINPDLFEHPDPSWKNDIDVLKSEGRATLDVLSGTKIYKEDNKTVFANWSMLDPGKELEIVLKYKLPFKVKKKQGNTLKDRFYNFMNPMQKELYPFSFLWQKQPGSLNTVFENHLSYPESWRVLWLYKNENFNQKGDLNSDKYWALSFEF